MDIRKIRRLIDLIEDSDISEIEISEGEETVRISRASQQPAPTYAHYQAPPPAPAPAPEAGGESAGPTGGTSPTAASEPQEAGRHQEAPMVGTFYRAPSPEAEPYVREGDWVNEGDVLCVIEAMKLFNEIEAEFSGRVKRILAENAQPVEFGEPLILIDPEG
jgi:acetyl-CoA carboxylase biotin carboxyl carrier protein